MWLPVQTRMTRVLGSWDCRQLVPLLLALSVLLFVDGLSGQVLAGEPLQEGHPVRSFWDPWKGSFRFIGVVIAALVFVVVPMLLYDRFKYSSAAAQIRGELARLAVDAPYFSWQPLRKRVEQAVKKFYDVRSTVDLSPVSKLFTPELLAKQQSFLKLCDKEGRQQVRRLKKLRLIEPVAVALEDERNPSRVRVVVRMDRIQYQREQYSLEIVEGAAEPQVNVEELWTLIYNGRKWLVHDIAGVSSSTNWPEPPSRAASAVSEHPTSSTRIGIPPAPEIDDAAPE